MTILESADDADPPLRSEASRVTVLAVLGDEPTRALLPRVLSGERLIIANDVARGLALAEAEHPDMVFVDLAIGNGAGLAMVHHMKAISPEASVFALATKSSLEAGAHAVSLGAAGVLLLPLGGDELLNAVGSVKMRLAEKTARAELTSERARLKTATEIAGGIKDPTTSAYSLAYYADVAGREVYRAGRYGRRLALMVTLIDRKKLGAAPGDEGGQVVAEVADHLLKAIADPALAGRVDEDEFHVLMPETDGVGGHTCRRRFLLQLGALGGPRASAHLDPRGVLVGTATFPHDGQDLLQLTNVARRRAESSALSSVHALTIEHKSLEDILTLVEGSLVTTEGVTLDTTAPRRVELPMEEAGALGAAAVNSALRGGSVLVITTYRPAPNIFRAVRAALGNGGPGITLRVLDVRASPGNADIEALCVLAEHGAYVLIGRCEGNVLRGVHAADPLLADALAVKIGRAAGTNLFG